MTHLTRVLSSCVVALATTLLLWDCTSNEPAPPAAAAPKAAPKQELVVFAAASLREAFVAIGKDFEGAQPGVSVAFNFAGSQELQTQLQHGAAADVFASADTHQMDEVVRAGRASSPAVFTRNEPVVIVSKEAAGKVRSLAELPAAERIVIGSKEVPIGRYTEQILERATSTLGADFRARVEAKVVSRELNVKHVLAKVRFGEAEAGVVYRTDAHTVPDVIAVTIPPEINVIAEFPIAVVGGAPHAELARAFVDWVQSARGQNELLRTGFLPVEASGR